MPPKSSKAQKRKSSIMVTTKKCKETNKEKLKWSHRVLETERNRLMKDYEELRKKCSYLETEISILSESNSENVFDLTSED